MDRSVTKGEKVAVTLQSHKVRGILLLMARRGQIMELRCEMPTCYCPQGRKHFVAADQPMPDWAPNVDHYPRLKSDGGKRVPGNVRLAHTLCNRRDRGWRSRIHAMLERNMSLKEIADSLNLKAIEPRPGEKHWTAASVRWAYVS